MGRVGASAILQTCQAEDRTRSVDPAKGFAGWTVTLFIYQLFLPYTSYGLDRWASLGTRNERAQTLSLPIGEIGVGGGRRETVTICSVGLWWPYKASQRLFSISCAGTEAFSRIPCSGTLGWVLRLPWTSPRSKSWPKGRA